MEQSGEAEAEGAQMRLKCWPGSTKPTWIPNWIVAGEMDLWGEIIRRAAKSDGGVSCRDEWKRTGTSQTLRASAL
jgi:hypothetical protein